MNPFKRIDVPLMLERLKIVARPRGGGRRLVAPCPDPAHDDRNPSWFIRDIPGEPYHAAHVCRGCGFKGGPINLVTTVLGLDVDEAREWLKDFTAPRPLPTRIEVEVMDPPPGRFVLPRCFKFGPLEKWPERHREYLIGEEKPRVEPWQVERWGLAFIDSRCACYQKRHANRVGVPVYNEHLELCSYTSRAIGTARLRYVEPRSKEHPRPGLFGAAHWSNTTRTLYVQEGVFDALAVEAVLVEHGASLDDDFGVVALRGSSLQPSVLSRFALFERVVVVTDPDGAGVKARDAIRSGCGLHTEVLEVKLPVGCDPSKLFETRAGRRELAERLVAA